MESVAVNVLTSVVIVDDHALLREIIGYGLVAAGCVVVGEAARGDEAVDVVVATRPDAVLMDIAMPGMDGIEAAARILGLCPEVRVVMLTAVDGSFIRRRAAEAGVSDYLLKANSSMSEVAAALSGRGVTARPMTADVEPDLTDRQIEMLQLSAEGCDNRAIAVALCIGIKTVHNHLGRVYRTLGVQTKTQAVLTAVRLGIVAVPGIGSWPPSDGGSSWARRAGPSSPSSQTVAQSRSPESAKSPATGPAESMGQGAG